MWWPQIPMSVSPICVSGISVLHFRTCWISALYFRTWRSLDKLWIFRVWPATFKYRRADGSKTAKTPSTLQACSFFSNPFLPVEFCLSTLGPAFSFIMLFQIFIQAFDTLKITEHRFGTRDTLKNMVCLSISQGLVLLLCNSYFYMNLNMHNSWPYWLSF